MKMMPMTSRRRAVLRLLLPALVLTQGCLCAEAEPTLEGPNANVANVIIHVQGVVRDGLTGLPLKGAHVSIPAAGERGDIDADDNGYYSVSFEGIGDFFVFVDQDRYARGRYRASANFGDTVPETSLNLRVVVDVLLFPLLGEVSGVVVGTGPLDAVAGARVIARVEPAYVPYVDTTGLELETTTSDTGHYALPGLPAGVPMRLLLPAQDLDDDGEPDFATRVVALGPLDEAPMTRNVQVDPFLSDQVVWTNFDNVESFAMEPDATFEFVYAAPMSTTPGATDVQLLRAGTRVATEHTWDEDGLVLRVQPRAPLTLGQTYSLAVDATTTSNDIVSWGPFSFSVGGDRVPGAVENLVLVNDPATITFRSSSFTVGFDAVEGATGYRVYARNDVGQSDWLQVAQRSLADLNANAPEITFTLPNAFESLPGTGTPFGFGETLEMAAVALIGTNEGPFSTTTVQVSDVACPTFTVSPAGSFQNSGSEPSEVYFEVESVGGEWIDPTTAPSIAFDNYALPGGGPFLLDGSSFVVEVIDRDVMHLVGWLPPGEDARLTTFTVDLSGLTDPSGNAACDDANSVSGLLGGGQSLSLLWDTEADDGWVGGGQWARGTPSAGPASAYVGVEAWGTVLDGDYDDTSASTSILETPQMVTPGGVFSNGSINMRVWSALESGDTTQVYFVPEAGAPTLIGNLPANTFSNWSYQSFNLPEATLGHVELRFTTDGDTLAGAGVFIDDIEVSGYWSAP